jgi:hypothetical protein
LLAIAPPQFPRIWSVVREITYKDWDFVVQDTNGLALFRIEFLARSTVTGKVERQLGRWWYLSESMSSGEIARTIFKAVLTAEEHEAREEFRFAGMAIFNPHFDLDLEEDD